MKFDVGISGVAKYREEVTGDTPEVIKTKDSITIILSDGLGSGIKASILSILTTKIAAGLIRRNIGLEQVFATIADTLPTCKVRNLAYATLSILKIQDNGRAHLIEYDNPELIVLSNGNLRPIERRKRNIAGKDVNEAYFEVGIGDVLLLNSDGVINAGVGGIFKLGLGEAGLIENLKSRSLLGEEVETIADKIAELAECCYLCEPCDDSTAIVIKARPKKHAMVFTGPPGDQNQDASIVQKFFGSDSQRIICGGASGNLVARMTGKKLKTSLQYEDPSVPPIANIEGVDLVTEGVLTLNKCLEKLEDYRVTKQINKGSDGATLLTKALLKADAVVFLMGTAFNPAHEEIMRSLQLKSRFEAVQSIENILSELGKEISMEVF
ncbi:MAG TPA: stage II sporulation protein E [Firmicutes bacterium]|nr:stage II sporulation protein E [Bacillota bacterium]